ncbi:MAG: DUF1080 domain-containing protein [Planctomycetaceae bacterium]|nr:DUF1080 domain-containing protein [Planctomycetaceae bacterium]
MTCLLSIRLSAAEVDSARSVSSTETSDFDVQGEYVGEVDWEGQLVPSGLQLIAGGDGRFTLVSYRGGLPGAGWDREAKRSIEAARSGDRLELTGGGVVVVSDQTLDGFDAQGGHTGQLKKVHRESPTLGLPAPPHATVLFAGESAEAFVEGQLDADGWLLPGVMSREEFQDCRLHVEFQTPFMPAARGQARGNSGVYLQGRYEVQILDSFGLDGLDNECGAIYGNTPPNVNMAFPPQSWQTYDIEFTAPRFDNQGAKTADARLTVRHNGVPIHQQIAVSGPTRASKRPEGPEPGPLYLQDHGNPVRFRNVWIVRQDLGL